MGQADVDFLMQITPVDFAARLAESPVACARHRHYHTITEAPITGVISSTACGRMANRSSSCRWRSGEDAARSAARSLNSPLVMGASAVPSVAERQQHVLDTVRRIAVTRRAGVSGVACPPLDQHLIGTYVDAMLRENPA